MAILFGLCALFGWGLTDFLAALNSRKIGNVPTLFWGQLGGLLVMFVYFWITKATISIAIIPILVICLAGIIQGLGGIAFYKSLEIGKVSLVSPIGSTFGVWTVILSLLFLHEKLTTIQLLEILLVIIGTFFVSTNFADLKKEIKKGIFDKGIILAFLASILWGLSFTIYSPALHQYGWLLSSIVLRISVVVTVGCFGYIFRKRLLMRMDTKTITYFLIMSLVDVIAYFGYSIGLEKGLTAVVSPVAAAFPLVTVLLAKLILKEKIALNQTLGILAVILGVVLLSL